MNFEENNALRERTGIVTDDRRIVSFLYDVLRDHLTPGVVEKLVQDAQNTPVIYSNGHLARYAQDVANRLK